MRDTPSLLLVDDDRAFLQATSLHATSKGFSVVTASTVREASMVITRQRSLDLILVDLSLPDGSGWDVIGHIDASYHGSIIVVTEYSDKATSSTAIRLRVDGYMVKPLDGTHLNAWLEHASRHATRRMDPRGHLRPDRTWRPHTLEEIERQAIEQTLHHCGHDKTRAAKILGISVKTIYNKLLRYREADAE